MNYTINTHHQHFLSRNTGHFSRQFSSIIPLKTPNLLDSTIYNLEPDQIEKFEARHYRIPTSLTRFNHSSIAANDNINPNTNQPPSRLPPHSLSPDLQHHPEHDQHTSSSSRHGPRRTPPAASSPKQNPNPHILRLCLYQDRFRH